MSKNSKNDKRKITSRSASSSNSSSTTNPFDITDHNDEVNSRNNVSTSYSNPFDDDNNVVIHDKRNDVVNKTSRNAAQRSYIYDNDIGGTISPLHTPKAEDKIQLPHTNPYAINTSHTTNPFASSHHNDQQFTDNNIASETSSTTDQDNLQTHKDVTGSLNPFYILRKQFTPDEHTKTNVTHPIQIQNPSSKTMDEEAFGVIVPSDASVASLNEGEQRSSANSYIYHQNSLSVIWLVLAGIIHIIMWGILLNVTNEVVPTFITVILAMMMVTVLVLMIWTRCLVKKKTADKRIAHYGDGRVSSNLYYVITTVKNEIILLRKMSTRVHYFTLIPMCVYLCKY